MLIPVRLKAEAMNTQPTPDLIQLLASVEEESGQLRKQIAEATKKLEVNQRLISALKEKFGTTPERGMNGIAAQAAAHGVSSDDYGWLTTAVKDYIQKCGKGEFNPTEMFDKIMAQHTERKAARTSIYPILKRMVEAKEITQTQQGIGRKPAFYKAL